MEEKMKNRPRIRFEGFSGEWERKALGNYTNITTGRLDANAMKEDGAYDFYTSGVQKFKIDVPAFEGPAITIAGNGATVGYMHLADGLFNAYQRTYVLTDFTENRQFLFYEIGNKLPKKISEEARTGNIPYIVMDMLTELEISIPSIYEQSQIGTLFQQLDTLAAQYRTKLTQLRNIKQSMLTKLFPQEGEDVPQMRFEGFEGEWERKMLGDISEIVGGGTPSTAIPEFWNGDIDWYSPTEIGKKVYAERSRRQITELGLEKSSARLLPPLRTILFTSRAGIGDMAILKNTGCTNQGFQSIVLKDNYDAYFIYSMGYKIKSYALRNASGSTFLEISGKELVNMTLLVPSLEEQHQIGQFFQQLDTLLSHHQKRIDKLAQLKSALLEGMFV